MFHSKTQSCIYPCKTTYTETKQMGNCTNLAGKIEHAQYTVQDCKITLQNCTPATVQHCNM